MGATSTPAPVWIPDQYETFPAQLDSPAAVFYAITTSDSVRLPKRPRAIYVGVAGDIVATGTDGVDVTFKNCYAGQILDIRPVGIKATGTTAGSLVALL
ncbi:spike base protein, RCAP_Rcc01079 family [Paraburkholderia caribensis]|uniref:spike base protein, RCAP_Rcc01079 family n=1 Tax=Paraburkholderia caribensis TaxID=75105 RepID=UPI002857E2FC|nr:hypothetical protein [Paraburkholderia caribensis]MDR6384251.1 hypothetical protein [Paraburkholderia caribensis]